MFKALFTVFEWIFKGAQVKFLVFSVVAAIFSLVVTVLVPLLNCCGIDTNMLSLVFNSLSPSTWYFINIFNFMGGLQLLLCAVVGRFIIRRLPFIG